MKAKVTTCNSIMENGVCVSGYHEIHEIKYLSGIKHLVATVNSIIRNNLLYGYKDFVLEEVVVEVDNVDAMEYISKHCKNIFDYDNVNVVIYLMYA